VGLGLARVLGVGWWGGRGEGGVFFSGMQGGENNHRIEYTIKGNSGLQTPKELDSRVAP